MGGYYDALMLQQEEKAQQQQAAQNARLYNPDGSAKSSDFRKPTLPASVFPNVTPRGGGDLVVHRHRLLHVAKSMQQDLADLRKVLAELNNGGGGSVTVMGWETADAFGNNSFNAYYGISQFYQNLNAAYDTVIAKLHQTVGNYNDAEAETVSAIKRVSPDTATATAAAGSLT